MSENAIVFGRSNRFVHLMASEHVVLGANIIGNMHFGRRTTSAKTDKSAGPLHPSNQLAPTCRGMFSLKLLRLVITHHRAMRAPHHHNRVYSTIHQMVCDSGGDDEDLVRPALALL